MCFQDLQLVSTNHWSCNWLMLIVVDCCLQTLTSVDQNYLTLFGLVSSSFSHVDWWKGEKKNSNNRGTTEIYLSCGYVQDMSPVQCFCCKGLVHFSSHYHKKICNYCKLAHIPRVEYQEVHKWEEETVGYLVMQEVKSDPQKFEGYQMQAGKFYFREKLELPWNEIHWEFH